MGGIDYYTQAEIDYRLERARRAWPRSRRRGRRAATTSRWQGPLRGAEEMR
ncbi:hypothetical protein [Nocardioides houyundeii]|uniref:hypothetical protein n=1 Tax=Nocardioides houyundeii TaxID=2045452 RepID=UPI0013151D34|nr:hypothetical protein [Nocardioides houyundeii]